MDLHTNFIRQDRQRMSRSMKDKVCRSFATCLVKIGKDSILIQINARPQVTYFVKMYIEYLGTIC